MKVSIVLSDEERKKVFIISKSSIWSSCIPWGSRPQRESSWRWVAINPGLLAYDNIHHEFKSRSPWLHVRQHIGVCGDADTDEPRFTSIEARSSSQKSPRERDPLQNPPWLTSTPTGTVSKSRKSTVDCWKRQHRSCNRGFHVEWNTGPA